METRTDGRLVRGDQTRRAVLRRAVDIASIDGLEGLSIGRLAGELEISKSGLFAHFGSKEELQLATIRAARRIYADAVVESGS
jgi:AcrR family transcriptional regulator